MINCNFDNKDPMWVAIQAQVARMENLPKFPYGIEAKRELCMALVSADSLAQATFVLDLIMKSDSTERCPSPPELRRMITAEQDRGKDSMREISERWRLQDIPAPRGLEQKLDRHLALIMARMEELRLNPQLEKQGSDGRKIQTPLRDELSVLTEELRGA